MVWSHDRGAGRAGGDALSGGGGFGRELAGRGRERLADAHLGDRAQLAATEVADVARSDLAPAAKDAVTAVTGKLRQGVLPDARHAVATAVDAVRAEV